jgi:hypothetical protein
MFGARAFLVFAQAFFPLIQQDYLISFRVSVMPLVPANAILVIAMFTPVEYRHYYLLYLELALTFTGCFYPLFPLYFFTLNVCSPITRLTTIKAMAYRLARAVR